MEETRSIRRIARREIRVGVDGLIAHGQFEVGTEEVTQRRAGNERKPGDERLRKEPESASGSKWRKSLRFDLPSFEATVRYSRHVPRWVV